jgi:dTDP-D-glucose 4,6-dehydratase
MIARAFLRQDPLNVWSNGEQIRNWTHVSDVVAGEDLYRRVIEECDSRAAEAPGH